jgi:hypothetical protein
MAAVKKTKVFDENRTFQSAWTEYYFICIERAAFCVVCNETVCVLKVYSIERLRNKASITSEWYTRSVTKGQNNSASKPFSSTN